jgi:hypothetical protein
LLDPGSLGAFVSRLIRQLPGDLLGRFPPRDPVAGQLADQFAEGVPQFWADPTGAVLFDRRLQA